MYCFLILPYTCKVFVIFNLLFFGYISFEVYTIMIIIEVKTILTLTVNKNLWKSGRELTMMH